jgi:branched-chain amino acid transport system ATP-binding protein
MLAIARALLGRPKLLMLDEPSLGLARIVIRDIYAALQTLREQGLTVLLVEQNATMAVAFADRSLVVVNGRVVLEGPRASMMGNEDMVRHYLGGAPASN